MRKWLAIAVVGIFLAGFAGTATADLWDVKVKCKGSWTVSVTLTRDASTLGVPLGLVCADGKAEGTIDTLGIVANDILMEAITTGIAPFVDCLVNEPGPLFPPTAPGDLKKADLDCKGKVSGEDGKEGAKVDVKARRKP